MSCIRKFNEIELKNDSLILCDIDDTVFDFGTPMEDYWKSQIDDPEFIIWRSIIQQTTPRITDENIYDFFDEAIEKNCEIHFITHRNSVLSDITQLHLNHYGISGIPVHFLTGASKSAYINKTFFLEKYNEIIFIDDSQRNIDDVRQNIENSKNYKFIK